MEGRAVCPLDDRHSGPSSPLATVASPSGDRMSLLRVDLLSRSFGGVVAVRDVSFELEEGEIIGLVGPNGSGKTTLLNLITGIYAPDSGLVALKGKRISGKLPHQVARQGIGRTYQTPRLFDSLTVGENMVIAEGGPDSARQVFRWWSRSRAILDLMITSILRDAGLTQLAGRKAGELAYGHRKRVDFLRCLTRCPHVILLDEPVAGLNSSEKLGFVKLLQKAQQELNVSMVVVDHDIDFIRSVCTRLVVLSSGSVVCAGDVAEVLANPIAKRAYFGV